MRSRERAAYTSALYRCTNPKSKAWKDYGGRGIKFLFTSFEQFMACIGPRPSSKHMLDRKDNNGHYEVGNVRWATRSEQNKNKRYGSKSAATRQALSVSAKRRGVAHMVTPVARKKAWATRHDRATIFGTCWYGSAQAPGKENPLRELDN
jgi:hypothetical protein